MKENSRVTIKDNILNKVFYMGYTTRKRAQKIYRIHYFLPKFPNYVKLKNDDGSLGTITIALSSLVEVDEV